MRHRQGRSTFRCGNICSRKRRRSHAPASTTPMAHVKAPLLTAVQQTPWGDDRKTKQRPEPGRLAAWRDSKGRIHKVVTQVATQLARQGPSTEPTPVARRIALAIRLADCLTLACEHQGCAWRNGSGACHHRDVDGFPLTDFEFYRVRFGAGGFPGIAHAPIYLSLIHISEPTRLGMISYAVFCLKKKKKKKQ